MVNLMLFTALFLLNLGSSYSQCSNASNEFKTNLRTLLDLLSKNAPLHNGFYTASVGNRPYQVFGILHCRANISRNDCANCFRYPNIAVLDACPMKNERETYSDTCTMKYSEENFFGVWSRSYTTTFGNNTLDDPLVFSKGVSMMRNLARDVPDQRLMYQAAVIDVGVNGKRYGLAQCGRDLSKLECQNCLENRFEYLRSNTRNRTGWEILGTGCSMWYSNVSLGVNPLPPSESQVPPEEPRTSSGVQLRDREIRIFTIVNIGISTLTLLFATQGLYLSTLIL